MGVEWELLLLVVAESKLPSSSKGQQHVSPARLFRVGLRLGVRTTFTFLELKVESEVLGS